MRTTPLRTTAASPSRSATAARLALLTLAAPLAACAGDRTPTAPAAPSAIPGAAVAAFQLSIDVASGRVTVGRPSSPALRTAAPRTPSGGERPSLSLVGSDAVDVQATNCTFTAVPNNARQKRCTFSLAIENRLQYTDLVTATTFPRPPQGTNGILVFPFSAAALGVPGGSATPTADWDRAPANFFNDFGSCSTKPSDCYRSELYAGPLYAGETSDARTVGFDVDKNAHTVSAYIVVAADLRDNPVQTLTIGGDPTRCGSVANDNILYPGEVVNLSILHAAFTEVYDLADRAFCSFDLAGVPPGVDLLSATLRVYEEESGGLVPESGPVVVDHVEYGTLDASDFDLAALTASIGTLPIAGTSGYVPVGVLDAVQDDFADGRVRSQFRLRLTTEEGVDVNDQARVRYSLPNAANPPQLVITYRLK